MSVAIIVNPKAGGASSAVAARRVAKAASVVDTAGGELFVTERRGHASELTARAVDAGHDRVIAWGGDGTVNEVARVLSFGPSELGIVPSGSGNGLARALGISAEPSRALREALGAPTIAIDAGEIGGRLFFSVAGIGFDAHVAALFDVNPSGRRGLAAYAWIAARELITYRSRAYRVSQGAPGDTHAAFETRTAFLMTFANSSQWGSGARIAPSARLDDGLLDLVIVEERSRLATCLAVPRLFTGGIAKVRGVSTRRVASAVVDAEGAIAFHVDGEPASVTGPLQVRVHPGALRVAVPRPTIR